MELSGAGGLLESCPGTGAGNAFILKPAEETPLTANMLADLFKIAGLPDGLFQVIHGDHQIGRAICAHQILRKFRSQAGWIQASFILAQSAQTLKKVTLELGGKAPLLVF